MLRFLSLSLLLVACNPQVECPEPIVCTLAKADEKDLQARLVWQAMQINRLTQDAVRIETAKDRCPVPNCHCAPKTKRHRKQHSLPYLGIE